MFEVDAIRGPKTAGHNEVAEREPDVTRHNHSIVVVRYRVARATPFAAFAIRSATARGCET